MSRVDVLEGGCSCGRNRFTIIVPPNANEAAQVFFDNGHHHRRSQATPLSAWLRVPLTWYQSTTYAFLADETPSSIRRSYTSPSEQHAKRHFCGFCGTPLSYWTESPPEEAEYISLTLGSLSTDKLRNLEDLGLLPKEATVEEDTQESHSNAATALATSISDRQQGLPWFDTLVEGSRLGRMRRTMGSRRSRDGSVQVEWEIVEWTDDDMSTPSSKRKLGDVVDEDSRMEGSS